MNAIQTALTILAKASLFDPTFSNPDRAMAAAWAEVLGDVNPDDAIAVVNQHYALPSPARIMPGDVLDGVKKIRAQRLRDVASCDLDPPDADPADVHAWLEARRLRIKAIADGTIVPPSLQPPSIEGQKRVLAEIEGRCDLPADVRVAFGTAQEATRAKRAALAARVAEAKAERRRRVEAARAELEQRGATA